MFRGRGDRRRGRGGIFGGRSDRGRDRGDSDRDGDHGDGNHQRSKSHERGQNDNDRGQSRGGIFRGRNNRGRKSPRNGGGKRRNRGRGRGSPRDLERAFSDSDPHHGAVMEAKDSEPESDDQYAAEVLRNLRFRTRSRKDVGGGNEVDIESETLEMISDINNPDWRTPGCRELRRITHYDGQVEELYFTPDKFHHKKVFVSFSIEDVEVDSLNETFHMKFSLQFNWIPSEAVYKSMYKAAMMAQQQQKPEILQKWVPDWVPTVEFDNVYTVNNMEWVVHPANPEKGPFRLATYAGKWGASNEKRKIPKKAQRGRTNNMRGNGGRSRSRGRNRNRGGGRNRGRGRGKSQGSGREGKSTDTIPLDNMTTDDVPLDNMTTDDFEVIKKEEVNVLDASTEVYSSSPKADTYELEKIKWICAELECDIVFREELEINSYPFDVQDLSCCFRLQKTATVDQSVFGLPNYFNPIPSSKQRSIQEPRNDLVGTIDSNFAALNEWNVENCLIEHEFSKIVISLKLSRRWRPILINTIFIIFLMSLLSFTVWSVHPTDAASRLELTMTLILTAVLFDTVSTPKPYLTYLDRYTLMTYFFMTLVMFENAAMGWMVYSESMDDDFIERVDYFCWIGLLVLFGILQGAFIAYAHNVKTRERKKIFLKYDEVKQFNNQYIEERAAFRLYDTECRIEGLASNKYKRSLAISGAAWPE